MTVAPCVHLDRRPAAIRLGRLGLVFGLTFVFMVVEAVGGWLAGSLALLADAGHMLTDVGALGLTLATAWIARRPADHTLTYGYLRWEILAALVNGALLFGVAAMIVVEAIGRLQAPPEIRGGLMLGVAGAGLLVNATALFLLHGDHRHHLNLRGAYLHILGDLLGSVAAVVAAVVILLTGWTLADPIISIALSLLILVGAWRLVRESVDVLLEAVPRHISLSEVESRMRAIDGVREVHDLHVWTVTSGMVAMSGHAVVPALDAHPAVLERIRRAVGELGVGHVTVQLETGREGDCDDTQPTEGPPRPHHC
ncbi:MAG: cation diffusion facilitator family transporter [Gemmatimonadota bacterium]|nr:cation diffusion facilitator family transporter [Gemmatimonadota bacterium]MDH5284595.1 cation diffusion facilitator family transporter [Gemmatimonadota bacterium]